MFMKVPIGYKSVAMYVFVCLRVSTQYVCVCVQCIITDALSLAPFQNFIDNGCQMLHVWELGGYL